MEWIEVLDKLSDKLGVLAILVIGYLIMKIKELSSRIDYLENQYSKQADMLSNIHADVSYMRGKIEQL